VKKTAVATLGTAKAFRPIYIEKLPGVAAHDSLFVSLRPGVAVHERRITRRNKTNKGLRLARPQCSLAFTCDYVINVSVVFSRSTDRRIVEYVYAVTLRIHQAYAIRNQSAV